MKPSEMLSKITTLLQAKVELEEMKLENGTIIEADSFASGESVFIVTEDEKVPMPIGEYTLEDGKSLIVEEEGVIASVGEAKEEEAEMKEDLSNDEVATGSKKSEEAPEEEAKEDEPEAEELSEEVVEENLEEDKDEMTQIVDAVVQAVSPMIEEMKEELGYVKDELGKMKEKEEEKLAKEKVEEEVKQELSETPASKPIKHNPEAKTDVKMRQISQNRAHTTYDKVFNKLFNK